MPNTIAIKSMAKTLKMTEWPRRNRRPPSSDVVAVSAVRGTGGDGAMPANATSAIANVATSATYALVRPRPPISNPPDGRPGHPAEGRVGGLQRIARWSEILLQQQREEGSQHGEAHRGDAARSRADDVQQPEVGMIKARVDGQGS